MPLGVRDVHINQALTNMAIGYHPQGLIAEQIFPIVPVAHETDYFYIWDRADAFRKEDTLRADGAESNEVEFKVTKDTYSAEEYAMKVGVTDREMGNADSVLQLKISKQKRLQDKLLVDLEYRIATLVATTTNWDTNNSVSLSGTDRFDNASYSDSNATSIEYRIDTAKEAIRKATGGLEPNVIIIPSAVAKVVKRNKTIRDLIKYTHADLLVDGDLPPSLWGLKVMIPKGSYATSNEGAATQTLADIWGKSIILMHVNPNPAIDAVSAGYIFRSRPWMTKEWREEWKSRDVIETGYVQAEKIVSTYAGYVIANCIS
jgi:hypothetical protein